jgi:hypothetical protein
MAFFRIGMRVRKVRGGFNVGCCGTVRFMTPFQVAPDADVRSLCGDIIPAGFAYFTFQENWEPIIDKHEAADDADFLKDLDRLLEKVGEAAG